MTGAAPIPARDFYFLRHGQTDGDLQRRAQRTADIALNEAGVAEAKDAANRFKGAGLIECIVSSPLRRAMETAAIVGDALKLPVRTDDALAECNFGAEQGEFIGPWHSEWIDGITPKGADPYRAYVERSGRALGRAISDAGTAPIVAHGGTYMAVTKYLLLSRPRKPPPDCVPLLHTPPQDLGNA